MPGAEARLLAETTNWVWPMRSTWHLCIVAAGLFSAGCTLSGGDASAVVPFAGAREIQLGMSRSQLLRARPDIYVDSDALRERLSSNDVLLYWFGSHFPGQGLPRNKLVIVTRSSQFGASDSARLLARVSDIRRQWSEQYGDPTALTTRVRRRGDTRRIYHAETWSGSALSLVLAYELPVTRADSVGELYLSQIAHDPRIEAEQVLPDR